MKKLYSLICKGEIFVSAAGLMASVALIVIQAVMRTMNHPINWGLYVALFLFTWSTFLGADVAYRNNATVFVDVFINRMPGKVQYILRLICHILELLFMIGLVYYGCVLFQKSWARPYQGLVGFSYSWVILSVPVGFGLMIISNLRKLYYEYIKHETALSDELED